MKKTIVSRLAFVSSAFAGALMFVNVASAQCDLFPIALPVSVLGSTAPGTVITNLPSGDRTWQFNWLSWDGSQRDSALVTSLTGNGDSSTYINPLTGENQIIQQDDSIVAQNEVNNNRALRNALNNLVGDVISVPVYDTKQVIRIGKRPRDYRYETVYHVVGFAQIQIIDYRLRGERDHLTFLFIDEVSCSSGPMD